MLKKILVIDDSATVRQQVGLALSQAGFDIVEAVDGLDGLNKVRAGKFSAVVCDVNMPRMNGLEFVESVKREGILGGIPIVMLTTEGDPELLQRARGAGVKGWIIKPFKADLLVATIQKLTQPTQPMA